MFYRRLNFSKYGKIKLLKFKPKLFIKKPTGWVIMLALVTFHLCSAQLGKSQLELITTEQRGANCQFCFQWIYYCYSSKSTGKKTGKTHLCAPVVRLKKIRQNNESKAISCWCQQRLYAYLSCKKLFQLSLLLFLTIRSKKIRKSQKITLRYTVSTWLNL